MTQRDKKAQSIKEKKIRKQCLMCPSSRSEGNSHERYERNEQFTRFYDFINISLGKSPK